MTDNRTVRPSPRRKNLFLAAALVLILLIVLVLVLSSLAHFTSRDAVTNRYSAADLDIKIVEDNFDRLPDTEKKFLEPNKLLDKDPRVRNTDHEDAFVFVRVTVPVRSITTVAEDGTRGVKSPQEIFWLKTSDDKSILQNSFHTEPVSGGAGSWVELPTFEEGTDLSADERTYVFGYSVYLKSGETTGTLFDYIQMKNCLQDEVEASSKIIVDVHAWGVQTQGVDGVEKDDNGAKRVLSRAELERVYRFAIDHNG